MIKPTLYNRASVSQFCNSHGVPSDQMRRLQYALYRMAHPIPVAVERLDEPLRAQLGNTFELCPLSVAAEYTSQLDRSIKLVLATGDERKIESVIMRTSGPGKSRVTACISTQVGCQAGCPFCATARMGLVRNLEVAEILEQVRIICERVEKENQRVRNIVFMGMGEPLHNEQAVHESIEFLTSSSGFAFPQRSITLSTVGVPDAMCRLIDRFPMLRVALSLHATTPDLRRRLVPWSRHITWDDLWAAIRYVSTQAARARKQGGIMIEYLMIEGVNDSTDDARRLACLLKNVNAVVNLIPYNPIPHVENWKPADRNRREAFGGVLRQAGLFTTIRYSMGTDIQAACGQLVQSSIPTG